MQVDWNSTEIPIDNLINSLSRREGIEITSLPDVGECVIYELKIDNEKETVEITVQDRRGELHRQIFGVC